ncbi:hypothetical protein CKJ84_04580 [Corynebacterium sp. NML 120412]|uniref:DUF3499 domain-containing protein n=1 Tax=Corynebacterium sp. NML 120412 TaxID=2029401 RepID=UPI000BAA6A70|nr:DUF3499 domain-containing protein [Corynebacterium sp. NML 120412]PAT15535.1 hypothetical protein CKJ84_04580 [Corynebacterium sp. NML 120412]
MSVFRRCCRPGCGRPAVATLIYAYADSTAVVGPLAPEQDPHSWDLCERHSAHITAPVGWDMVRVEQVDITEDPADLEESEQPEATEDVAHAAFFARSLNTSLDDLDESELTALAEAVREAGEAGRVTTGLVDTSADPIEYSASHDFNDPATSNHPVHRTKRIEAHLAAHKAQRRAHLRVVPDPSENADKDSGTE